MVAKLKHNMVAKLKLNMVAKLKLNVVVKLKLNMLSFSFATIPSFSCLNNCSISKGAILTQSVHTLGFEFSSQSV